jgi:hypothetical protein
MGARISPSPSRGGLGWGWGLLFFDLGGCRESVFRALRARPSFSLLAQRERRQRERAPRNPRSRAIHGPGLREPATGSEQGPSWPVLRLAPSLARPRALRGADPAPARRGLRGPGRSALPARRSDSHNHCQGQGNSQGYSHSRSNSDADRSCARLCVGSCRCCCFCAQEARRFTRGPISRGEPAQEQPRAQRGVAPGMARVDPRVRMTLGSTPEPARVVLGHGWPKTAASGVCSLWLLSLAQARESDSGVRRTHETRLCSNNMYQQQRTTPSC